MKKENAVIGISNIAPHVRYAHVCKNARSSTHQVPERCIYDHEFLFVIEGEMEIVTGDRIFTLTKNTIHIIPPLVYHELKISENQSCTYYSVHFDFIDLGRENDFSPEEIYISTCNRNIDSVPINDLLVKRPQYVIDKAMLPETASVRSPFIYTELLESIIKVQCEKPFAWEIDIKCSMMLLLKQIIYDNMLHTGKEPLRKETEYLNTITAYIVDHYNKKIDFDELTRIFGCSYSSFRKQFKKSTGMSPHSYIINLRMKKAMGLLKSRKYTVSEVAYMVGYEDSSYFSRIFRKHQGYSPSEFASEQITKNSNY